MIGELEKEVLPMVFAPFEAEDCQDRIYEYVDRQSKLFEYIRNFYIGESMKRYTSDVIAADAYRVRKIRRDFLKRALPKEVQADKFLFEALDMVTSFEAFRKLREENGLSATRAKEVVRDTVRRLIVS